MIGLSVQNVQKLTEILEPDILSIATLVTSDVFEKAKINVIKGIENINKLITFEKHVGVTRRYQPGNVAKATIGRLLDNDLKVEPASLLVQDNIQNYREKEPFHVATDGSHNATNSEFLIRQMVEVYAGDNLMNLFFGQLGDGAYGLYNGYFTKIANAKNRGIISVAKKNLIETEEIDTLTGSDPASQNFDIFEGFVNALDPRLKAQKEILVYCSEAAAQLIIAGYMAKYTQLQPTVLEEGWKFANMPKVTLVGLTAMGEGSCLIATTPFNFDFGCDVDPDSGLAAVTVERDNDDHNILDYQITTAQGVRIRQYDAAHFAINNQANTAPAIGAAGEYLNTALTLSVNNNTMGSAAVTVGAKDSYQEGDQVTIAATANAGYKFVKWSDGVTLATRTYIVAEGPNDLQAVFEAESSSSSSSSN